MGLPVIDQALSAFAARAAITHGNRAHAAGKFMRFARLFFSFGKIVAFGRRLLYCQCDLAWDRESTMKLHQRSVTIVAIAAAFLSLAVSGIVIWRVERALGKSRLDAAQKELLAVEERPLGALPNPGFEGIWAPAVFKARPSFRNASAWPVRLDSMPTRPMERWSIYTAWESTCLPLPSGRWRWEC
jgi:hypothetical protein